MAVRVRAERLGMRPRKVGGEGTGCAGGMRDWAVGLLGLVYEYAVAG